MSSKDHDQNFAKTALEAFQEAGHYTDVEIAEAGGPSSSWMTELRKIRDGLKPRFEARPRNDTLKRIDTAAGWPSGFARHLLYTGELPDQRPRSVGPTDDTSLRPDFVWNTRRPEGISDTEHQRIVRETEEYYRFLIERASQER